MKKIYFTALAMFTMFSVSFGQKMVLVEEFTQASCPPCEQSTPGLNATLDANADKVVQLRYQTSWPGVDPMNADNPTEVAERVTYYGVSGVPDAFVNGGAPTGVAFPVLVSQANIDNAYAADADLDVTVTHVLSDDLSKVDVTVTITNNAAEDYDLASDKLRVAMVEEKISWDNPPGSTSITVFDAVLKTFITGSAGMDLDVIAASETWTNTWEEVVIPNTVYNFKEFSMVAFIQNDADRSVLNAAKSEIQELEGYPDLSAASAGSAAAGYCDYTFSPELSVSNQGDAAATGFTATLYLNGDVAQAIVITEELAAAGNTSIVFDDVQLTAGANEVYYTVQADNGDFASFNNETPAQIFAKASEAGTDLSVQFENVEIGATPDNFAAQSDFQSALNFSVFDQEALNANDPLGGFGESARSFMVNFWQWNPASVNPNGTIAVLDQFTVSNDAIKLNFDYAFTTWGASQDRLIVELSTDCGGSYTELFNKAGADLATAPELNLNDQYFRPAPGDWVQEDLDLTEWMGEDVLIRFSVVSAWGDMLYLDNIATDVLSSNNELAEVKGLEVYPNPTNGHTNVNFDLTETKDVTMYVIDNLGRIVASESFGNLSGYNQLGLDLSNLANGVYMLQTQFGDENLVNRITVSK